MTGIEMMIVNVLNGIGIDPKDIMTKANNLINTVETSLVKLDNRLSRIEKALNIIDEDEAKQIASQEIIEQDNLIKEKMNDKYN